jgi:toxin ParE1/3/4
MRLRIAGPADRDIDEVLVFGRRVHGERQADGYLLGLLEYLDQVPLSPFAAQMREEASPPVRLRVYRAHNIIYDVTDDEVVILRILHHSVNWVDEL